MTKPRYDQETNFRHAQERRQSDDHDAALAEAGVVFEDHEEPTQ